MMPAYDRTEILDNNLVGLEYFMWKDQDNEVSNARLRVQLGSKWFICYWCIYIILTYTATYTVTSVKQMHLSIIRFCDSFVPLSFLQYDRKAI